MFLMPEKTNGAAPVAVPQIVPAPLSLMTTASLAALPVITSVSGPPSPTMHAGTSRPSRGCTDSRVVERRMTILPGLSDWFDPPAAGFTLDIAHGGKSVT